jgi:hypothetical protein
MITPAVVQLEVNTATIWLPFEKRTWSLNRESATLPSDEVAVHEKRIWPVLMENTLASKRKLMMIALLVASKPSALEAEIFKVPV